MKKRICKRVPIKMIRFYYFIRCKLNIPVTTEQQRKVEWENMFDVCMDLDMTVQTCKHCKRERFLTFYPNRVDYSGKHTHRNP